MNIRLARGVVWIDNLWELQRKASFFHFLSLAALSLYLWPGWTSPFSGRSLSLNLCLFASLFPLTACFCPLLAPNIFSTISSFYQRLSWAKNTYFTEWFRQGTLKCCVRVGISLSSFVSLLVLCVGPQQCYLCFAHLSPHYLLCHGTVNVSDGDRATGKDLLHLFCVYFVILPSRFLLHLSEASRAESLSGSQVYTLERERGFKQTASLLLT